MPKCRIDLRRALAGAPALCALAIGLPSCGSSTHHASAPSVPPKASAGNSHNGTTSMPTTPGNTGAQKVVIVYTVTGTGPIRSASKIEYSSPQSHSDTTYNQELPWTKTLTTTADQVPMATLDIETSTEPGGSATCDITVNGKGSPSSHQESDQGGHLLCTESVSMP